MTLRNGKPCAGPPPATTDRPLLPPLRSVLAGPSEESPQGLDERPASSSLTGRSSLPDGRSSPGAAKTARKGRMSGRSRPWRCPDLPGIIPRFGTSLGPAGPFAPFRLAGSNPRRFGNGFSPAKAGFPVLSVGMTCPCLEICGSAGRITRPRPASGRAALVHFQGTPWRRAVTGAHPAPLMAPCGASDGQVHDTQTPLPRPPSCHNLPHVTTAPPSPIPRPKPPPIGISP